MAMTMMDRTNEEWLGDLRGPNPDESLSDLRAILVRGLRYAAAEWRALDEASLEDFAQEALLRILASLDSFRGESRFTTWAQKIAIRVALSDLRRQRWSELPLEEMPRFGGNHSSLRRTIRPPHGPEQQAVQRMLVEMLHRLMRAELTERQGKALSAVYLKQIPVEDVARSMGTNPNALYKLLHDARIRLATALISRGVSSTDVAQVFGV
jgi:RNA polymerase sigma-70 factor (ECF subfamily)